MSSRVITYLPVVLFRHQGQCYAIEASAVKKQGQFDRLATEVLGNFSELFTAPLASTESAAVQWLELQGNAGQAWRLGLSAAAELIELPVECIYPLPAILAALREMPALHALALFQNELIALLDAAALQQMLERKTVECSKTL